MMFHVGNSEWHLIFLEPSNFQFKKSDDTYTIGVSDNNEKCVYVANNLSDDMKEKVICHELTHCICFEYNISLPIETEEWLCNFMSDHGKEIIYLLDDLIYLLKYQVA